MIMRSDTFIKTTFNTKYGENDCDKRTSNADDDDGVGGHVSVDTGWNG